MAKTFEKQYIEMKDISEKKKKTKKWRRNRTKKNERKGKKKSANKSDRLEVKGGCREKNRQVAVGRSALFRRRNHQFRLMNSDVHFENERKCRGWEETQKSSEEGAMAREIDANLGCQAARGKKGMNNEGNKREKGKEREKERNSSKVRSNERHAKFSCKRQPQQEQGRLKTIAE